MCTHNRILVSMQEAVDFNLYFYEKVVFINNEIFPMSKLLEGPVKNGPESFEITVEIECTKFLKKANNLLKTCSSKIKIEDNLY